VLAVERQVVGGVAGAQDEAARQRTQGRLDGFGGHLGDGRLVVDRRTVCGQHVEGAARVEHHAHLGEDVERRLVDAAHLVGRDHLEHAMGADAVQVGVANGAGGAGRDGRAVGA
jgi:hypothetical protein